MLPQPLTFLCTASDMSSGSFRIGKTDHQSLTNENTGIRSMRVLLVRPVNYRTGPGNF
jgi:hypothetical protein